MASSNGSLKQTDPLQGIFNDIKKILEFIEIKDQSCADKYETYEMRYSADMYIGAMMKKDTYLTYTKYWDIKMFKQDPSISVTTKKVRYWMEHPYEVPLRYRDTLLEEGRAAFLASYEEKNDYYRTLAGLPPIGSNESDFIYLTESVRNQLHAPSEPVHLLSTLIQNNYMATDEYQKVLAANPTKTYLKYLGSYKIDPFIARRAKDFEILRYPLNRSDINPNLVNKFGALYADYREYVMTTLYNDKLEDLFTGYRPFMGLIIMMSTLMQLANNALESLSTRNFLDDSTLHILLSMYGIPDNLLLTNEVRRNLVINLVKLVQEKGTDDVYYDLVDILGYSDVVISKLIMMKGQQFDSDSNYKATDNVEPYFIKQNLKEHDIYDSINNGNIIKYDYHSIIDSDPTWWDLDDTRKILNESQYTLADTKYITVDAVVHQIEYMFESIYFTRLILDNNDTTDSIMIEIPEIFGTETVSIYDLIIYIISATCMNMGLKGTIPGEEVQLLATAGFNFDLDIDSFTEYINSTRYVDKERILSFMESITIKSKSDITRLMEDVLYPMREWLETIMSRTSNRQEYLEYENIYRAFYTYDIAHNSFIDDFKSPMEIIRDKYELRDSDIKAYQYFYPHNITGEALTIDTYHNSRYRSPFISRDNEIDWWIHITIETPYGDEDRGYVYLYDILNSPDLRTLTNDKGDRVFMDYEDGDVGWEVNKLAVEKALSLIDKLDEEALHSAKFQVDTPIPNSGGNKYSEGEYLPYNIRTGIYKNILKDKIQLDMDGLSEPPTTYLEYLRRRNEKLYNLLIDNNRFETNKDAWSNDVMKIILMVETELNLHMKYFEQSVVGSEMFFKPLVTLINHFKSVYVRIAKTSLRHDFGDKIDAGGNSNMLKLFDEVKFVIHFVTLAYKGYNSQFGLFDTEHKLKHHITMNDRSQMMRMKSDGFEIEPRTAVMGSMHMVDEVKFYKNGSLIDVAGFYPSWYSGEPGTGRWSEEDNIIMAGRTKTENVTNLPVDLDGWKDFVESYSPVE